MSTAQRGALLSKTMITALHTSQRLITTIRDCLMGGWMGSTLCTRCECRESPLQCNIVVRSLYPAAPLIIPSRLFSEDHLFSLRDLLRKRVESILRTRPCLFLRAYLEGLYIIVCVQGRALKTHKFSLPHRVHAGCGAGLGLLLKLVHWLLARAKCPRGLWLFFRAE